MCAKTWQRGNTNSWECRLFVGCSTSKGSGLMEIEFVMMVSWVLALIVLSVGWAVVLWILVRILFFYWICSLMPRWSSEKARRGQQFYSMWRSLCDNYRMNWKDHFPMRIRSWLSPGLTRTRLLLFISESLSTIISVEVKYRQLLLP